jgi:putative ABC transport system ATP-binding protein
MAAFLECGPFSARDGEGRVLFESTSLALDSGQFVTLEGASGSGKSTLLRHVTALERTTAAERSLGGASYREASLPEWRKRVTLIAQDAPMLPGSVRDNLIFPFAQRAGRSIEFAEVEAARRMSAVGLESLPFDRDVRTISGGERHRLALLRGLLWDPPVLVTDEPLAGLDPDTAARCFELLERFARRPGRLLLCALHDPDLNQRADLRLRLAGKRLEVV